MFRIDSTTDKQKKKDSKNHSKEDNFWLWFLWILNEARILDTQYSVKGSYIWLDWGYKLFMKIYHVLQKAYQTSGHLQMQFPTLLKEETFLKESEFIRNFEDEVFWVDREGSKVLQKGNRLVLRPTSEMIIYPTFSRWVQSWRDLPLKIFQNVSAFRCETNSTRPLIRNRETIGFIEGHSAFQTKGKALKFLGQIWTMYQRCYDDLGIPIILVKVPKWDRFAGSSLTVDGYTVFPDGRSLELFTTAYLGTTFSEIFDISYLDNNREENLAHLLCYGPSIDRILATIIALYGDETGLRLLPSLSPVDLTVVPIYNSKNKQKVLTYSRQLAEELTKTGFAVELEDDDQLSPGAKFFKHERLGIPIRLEIGPKEVAHRTLTIFRRDTKQRVKYQYSSQQSLKTCLEKLQFSIEKNLRAEISSIFQSHNKNLCARIDTIEFGNFKFESNAIYSFKWCGSQSCAEKLEKITALSVLGFSNDKDLNSTSSCICCSRKGSSAFLAKKY